jgi:OmpA-OmpF porin, OOP family
MKIINFLLPLLLSASLFSCISVQFPTSSGRGSQPQGNNSRQQRLTDKGIIFNQITVTDKYTVLDMTFTNNVKTPDGQGGLLPMGVGINPNAKLYALGGTRVFSFVKAENSVYDPKRMYVPYGQSARFTLYFERLDSGIEVFDLFECNDSDQETCWNFYNLRVINPAPTPPPVVKSVPVPVPTTTPAPTILTPEKKQPKQTTPLPEPKIPTTAPTPTVPTGPLDVLVKGTVTDAKTKQPVSATINFQYSLTKQVIDSTQSFPSNGLYKLKIPGGYVYQVIASAKGYLVTQDVLDLSKNVKGQNETKNLVMTPFAVGDKVTLKNIYFEMSKADLLSASFAELDKLVAMMTENPTMEIELEGHTDIIGDHDLNLQLSKDRVWNVRKCLVKKGINVDRIKAVGYGDTKPIITKGTDEQRKINRRVEFVVLKM